MNSMHQTHSTPIKHTLPAPFKNLEHLVGEWALPNEQVRYAKLVSISKVHLQVFFDEMLPQAKAIIDFLAPHEIKNLQGDLLVLYQLLVTFVETAHPIELNWETTNIEFSEEPTRLNFHGPSAQH